MYIGRSCARGRAEPVGRGRSLTPQTWRRARRRPAKRHHQATLHGIVHVPRQHRVPVLDCPRRRRRPGRGLGQRRPRRLRSTPPAVGRDSGRPLVRAKSRRQGRQPGDGGGQARQRRPLRHAAGRGQHGRRKPRQLPGCGHRHDAHLQDKRGQDGRRADHGQRGERRQHDRRLPRRGRPPRRGAARRGRRRLRAIERAPHAARGALVVVVVVELETASVLLTQLEVPP
eukprot:scaffold22814_cov59-Phaeocystis_antarctica.AAC.5